MQLIIHKYGLMAAVGVCVILFSIACDKKEVEPEQIVKEPKGDNLVDKLSEEAQLLAEGKKAWRPCAKCHCATDPRIKEDENWVKLNEETT